MSNNKDDNSDEETPSVEAIRSINARIDEIERRQRQDEEDERRSNHNELVVNRTVAVFTSQLFVTSAISDMYLLGVLTPPRMPPLLLKQACL